MTWKLSHAYIEWTSSILYIENELHRIYRNFYHPQTDKLYALMKRACPNENKPETMSKLEKIQSTCDDCRREAEAP